MCVSFIEMSKPAKYSMAAPPIEIPEPILSAPWRAAIPLPQASDRPELDSGPQYPTTQAAALNGASGKTGLAVSLTAGLPPLVGGFCNKIGRVEVWRGDCRVGLSVSAAFVWRCLTSRAVTPFPHPAHRTGHADLPHPALGQDFTPSPTTRRAQAGSGVRARSARKGARVDRSRPCVA